MTFLAECAGVAVGIPSIRCASAASDYYFGWALILLLIIVLFVRLSGNPIKDRFTTTFIAASFATIFMAAIGLLPEIAFTWAIIVAVGAAAIQMFTR